MKAVSILAAAGLIAVAQAQTQCNAIALKVPGCATSCIQSAATKVGCGALDFACQCGAASSAAINSAAFACVLSGCGPTTGLAVQTSAQAVCACASSAGASSAPASSAPASSAAMATSMASGSSMAASSAAASSMMASSAASAGSTAAMAGSTAGASMASSAAPAGSSAASSPSSGASSSGIDLKVIAAIGTGLAAFFVGMVAL